MVWCDDMWCHLHLLCFHVVLDREGDNVAFEGGVCLLMSEASKQVNLMNPSATYLGADI